MRKYYRKIYYFFLGLLPELLRDEVIRRAIRLPENISENLVIKIHALPTTTTLVAMDRDQIMGTLTVVRDNRLGLPLDRCFDVNSLRKNSNRLAEITSLSIHKDYRRKQGGDVLFPLLKLMYEYSTSHFGVNHLVVTVHPKEAYFYKSLLLFQSVVGTGVQDYLGAPAIVLHLDLQKALKNYETVYSKRKKRNNLFDFFIKRKIENIKLPQRIYKKISDPLVTLEYYQNVFLKDLNLSVDPRERRRVEAYFRPKDIRRGHPRIESDVIANLEYSDADKNIYIPIVLKDVSRYGFRACAVQELPVLSEYRIQIEIAHNLTANVLAQITWINPDLGYGFQIIQTDEKWKQFIEFLYLDQFKKAA